MAQHPLKDILLPTGVTSSPGVDVSTDKCAFIATITKQFRNLRTICKPFLKTKLLESYFPRLKAIILVHKQMTLYIGISLKVEDLWHFSGRGTEEPTPSPHRTRCHFLLSWVISSFPGPFPHIQGISSFSGPISPYPGPFHHFLTMMNVLGKL